MDAGQLGLDQLDALDRLDAVPPALLHAGRQGQGEGVEQQVAGLEAVAVDGEVVDGLGRAQLPLGGAGLALLVDARAHDRRPVLPSQREEAVEAGAGGVAVLQVHRVEDGLAADPLEGGLDDGRLGGVDDEGDARLGGEPADDLVHVGDAVLAGVVDADVEDVGALLDLVTGHGHAGVPVAGQHGLAELQGPVGVGALPHDQERRVLSERDRRVDRRRPGLVDGVAQGRLEVGAALDDGPQVLGRGAAAAADDRHAELGDEPVVVLGQLRRRQVVVHLAVDHRRQPGVGQAGDRHPAVAGQVAEVLVHLGRAGGAVEADDVGPHGVEGGEGGGDLGAGQHPPGQLDGDLDLDGHLTAGGGHRPPAADDGGLGLQEVEDGLDDEEVDAAVEQAAGLHLVGVAHLGEADLSQRRELGAGADRAGHPAGPVGRREPVGHLLGDLGRRPVQLVGPVGDPVLRQRDRQGPEGVGLDHLAAHLEERPVEVGDDVGAGGDQDLVAALHGRPAEVVGAEVAQLQVGAGGAVVDEDPLARRVEIGAGHWAPRLLGRLSLPAPIARRRRPSLTASPAPPTVRLGFPSAWRTSVIGVGRRERDANRLDGQYPGPGRAGGGVGGGAGGLRRHRRRRQPQQRDDDHRARR